ncbi:PilN domain-containing protein [Candidatus Peregrinibacteria bacterium]|jgi:Tfp pilus assembly protein PilN|nr:PilN domain-containing protein [Candidatus Peregrinibacteria bacterium]MBT4632021.1 PilN domain-containing protein [Candidatus Peregrinibacteria bacterium]MBT5516280.1 PilN domain-containing protein [Candidatus Peregrinibacteria bacterium]MBT5824401.1 PilN domain-containing protein [Candidatus Peregrinibacteria bacterium]
MDNVYKAPQGRLLPSLVVFLFVLGILYTLFLLATQWNLNRDMNNIIEETADLEAKLAVFEEDQIGELFEAQQIVDKVEAEEVLWSQIVKKLQDITPITVFFSSYSTSDTGELSLSGLGDSYGAVSDVIAALEKSSDFTGVFVPTVTLGSTGDGQQVVSFSLNVNAIK